VKLLIFVMSPLGTWWTVISVPRTGYGLRVDGLGGAVIFFEAN
jgi:hypothetical protein